MSNILYIIGNGFDLAHGLKTRYQDFKKWLLQNGNQYFVKRIEALYPAICNNNGEWNDIERALGIFKMDEVITFDKFFMDCECQEETYNDVGANIKSVTVVLPKLLHKWIDTIRLENVAKIYEIDLNSIIINFNYTSTIEQVYEMEPTKVFHIHSSLKENSKEFIIGYRPEDGYDNNVWDAAKTNDDVIRHNLLTNMIKPIDLCKYQLHCFFSHLSQINEVRVIGHSCSRIDEPYFMDIARTISKNAKWSFYIHDEVKKESYERFANRITKQDNLDQVYEVKNCKEIVVSNI